MTATTIRDALPDDVPAITAIYNETVASTTVSWTEQPDTVDQRREWFARQQAHGFPVIVAETDDRVVGFASYGEFRDIAKWPGYRFTVEHSIHVDSAAHGAGIGRALMERLLDAARRAGLRVMIGAIDAENAASLAFHSRLGFAEVGRLHHVGFKFGRWLDLVMVEIDLAIDAQARGSSRNSAAASNAVAHTDPNATSTSPPLSTSEV